MGCYNIYFTTQVSLHDEWGPRLEISVVEGYPAVFLPPDGFWRDHHLALLHLATTLSHMGLISMG
jgi:hypothetical protein